MCQQPHLTPTYSIFVLPCAAASHRVRLRPEQFCTMPQFHFIELSSLAPISLLMQFGVAARTEQEGAWFLLLPFILFLEFAPSFLFSPTIFFSLHKDSQVRKENIALIPRCIFSILHSPCTSSGQPHSPMQKNGQAKHIFCEQRKGGGEISA